MSADLRPVELERVDGAGRPMAGAQARPRAERIPLDDDVVAVRPLTAGTLVEVEGAGVTPASLDAVVRAACADASLWGTDLTRVPGFAAAVRDHLARLVADGVARTLETHLAGAAT